MMAAFSNGSGDHAVWGDPQPQENAIRTNATARKDDSASGLDEQLGKTRFVVGEISPRRHSGRRDEARDMDLVQSAEDRQIERCTRKPRPPSRNTAAAFR